MDDIASEITLSYGAMLTMLGGGLALFLYGMRKLADALKTLAGERMKNTLARLTTNRFTGLAAGAAVTTVIQSSSVTTVLVVGFISAGLMTFTQSIGVIMGANIGTTVTAQIVAFRITQYALVMIAAGFLLEVLGRSPRTRQAGIALMGLGLLFFGMELMSEAMQPLRAWGPFSDLMRAVGNPALGIVVGFAFTALVQSSSATTGVAIVLAGEGLVSLETGIALALGANVGTCVTAMLSAIGRPREAVRAALVHVAFNLLGVSLWIAFIPELAELVRAISPQAAELTGAARAAAEAPRQIANAHTLFNVVNALVLIWFAGPLAALVLRIVPQRAARVAAGDARYLEPMYLDQPALALDRVGLELGRLGRRVLDMTRDSFEVVKTGDARAVRRLRARDENVDALHGDIVEYLGRISVADLVDPLPRRLQQSLGVANYLENVADVVETDLMQAAEHRDAQGLVLAPAATDAIAGLHTIACEVLDEALCALGDADVERALAARERKAEFNALADTARQRSARELATASPAHLEAYRLETDVIECYGRIHQLARRIARLVALGVRPPDKAPPAS